MEALLIEKLTGKNTKLLLSLLEALKIPFRTVTKEQVCRLESSYDQEFVEKIRRSEQEALEGKVHEVNFNDFWNLNPPTQTNFVNNIES